MDIFYIYNENEDGNWLFRAASILTYGAPDHHTEIRETVCDYIATRYGRFYYFILGDLNDYIDQILDEGTWRGEPEVVAFSELYNVQLSQRSFECQFHSWFWRYRLFIQIICFSSSCFPRFSFVKVYQFWCFSAWKVDQNQRKTEFRDIFPSLNLLFQCDNFNC